MKLWNENKIIIITSVVFAVVFAFAHMALDDVAGMHVENGGLIGYCKKSVGMYFTWASRVIVNFVVFVFTDNNPIYWAIFNGISMLAMLAAIKKLFIGDGKKASEIFMVCLVALFPYWHLASAGWMATVSTYFSPMAFGMLSLVPIKKICDGEQIEKREFVFYLACLIYGANNEQVMVVILLAYVIAFGWQLFMNKELNNQLLINVLAASASAIFIFTCPGNAARKIDETVSWFPGFGHLNVIDKAELGYETAAQWLVFGNNLFFEVICVLLCILVWIKYGDRMIRTVALIPAIMTVAFGPFKTILTSLYPQIDSLAADIPYWGLVNPANRGGLGPFAEFFLISICLFIVLANALLLCREWKNAVVIVTLLFAGFASRVAMGISPTIYVSGSRTSLVMCFCIIAVMIYIFSINEDLLAVHIKGKRQKKLDIVIGVMEILAGFAVLNLISVIYNTFL